MHRIDHTSAAAELPTLAAAIAVPHRHSMCRALEAAAIDALGAIADSGIIRNTNTR